MIFKNRLPAHLYFLATFKVIQLHIHSDTSYADDFTYWLTTGKIEKEYSSHAPVMRFLGRSSCSKKITFIFEKL